MKKNWNPRRRNQILQGISERNKNEWRKKNNAKSISENTNKFPKMLIKNITRIDLNYIFLFIYFVYSC